MWLLIGGAFLGWALGANHAANLFGTAVCCQAVRYRTAVLVSAAFIIAGALVQGHAGLESYNGLQAQTPVTAFITTFTAAVMVALMTVARLPVSASQAVVGAILGISLAESLAGRAPSLDPATLTKIVVCWVTTPATGALCAVLLYGVTTGILRVWRPDLITREFAIRSGLIAAVAYAAFALGANNVANVVGPLYGAGLLREHMFAAELFGGIFMALGVATFGRRVMETIGSDIVPLEPITALVAVLAEAITVHFYAVLGVPVSTTQAIVGAVFGIGLLKGMRTIRYGTLARIGAGWVLTPLCTAILTLIAMLGVNALR
ncbi:MAG: inorganic phosphate transporter [Planctomycetota bacterium]